MRPSLSLLGLSHKTAPVEIREQLEIPADMVRPFLESLRGKGGVREAAVISTCNRVEIYFISDGRSEGVLRKTEALLAEAKGLRAQALKGMTYMRREEEAVKHLFRVAGGLDSLVLGEPQILGQVKEAFQRAREAGGLGPTLMGLFERALHAGKRIRSETRIGEKPVSVSFMAVALARKVFGELRGRTVLVVGAGKTGRETLVHLQTQGVGRVLVANRTFKTARSAAEEVGGQAVAWPDLARALPEADIVICSTGAPQAVISRQDLAAASQARRGKPLLIVDIAVPRDVEPSASDLENVYLYNIDDLQGMVKESLSEREREVPRAEAIIEEEARALAQKNGGVQAAPLVVALRSKVSSIETVELEKAAKRFGWSVEQQAEIARLLSAVSAKVLHGPTLALKQDPESPQGVEAARLVRRMFGLE